MTFICKCGREFRSWAKFEAHLRDHNVMWPKRQNRMGDPHGCAKARLETLKEFLARQEEQGHAH